MKQFEKLTPEQSERLMDCKTPEDILSFAQSEGYELTDEQLESLSGGWAGKCDGYTCTSDTCESYARNIGE